MDAKDHEDSDNAQRETGEPPAWSENLARWIEYEQFIQDVSKRRTPPEPPKAWWQRLLESGVGAALITVLIGGFLGQMISSSFQTRQSIREHNQALRKAQNDQALVAYNSFLEKGADTIKHVYELIGSCIAVSDDVVEIKSNNFSPTQRKEILTRYNAVGTQWKNENLKLGLLMRYFHHNDPGVGSAWQSIQESIPRFMDCQYSVYANQKEGCDNEKKAILNALDSLTKSHLEIVKKHELKLLAVPEGS